MLITYIRNASFYALQVAFALFFIPVFSPLLLINGKKFGKIILDLWFSLIKGGCKNIIGIDHKLQGDENLREALLRGPCLFVAKHQSSWETGILGHYVGNFCFIIKKELSRVPLYGWFLKKSQMIFVDRSGGSRALKDLLIQAKERVAGGTSIIIFPEGTRTMPGQKVKYQIGVAFLYESLNIPVVPIAHNSGVFWGRKGFKKKPGEITLQFLPIIEPGLSREEFMEKIKESIEGACAKMPTTTKDGD